MEDPAFLVRRIRNLKRHRRIRIIGLSLIAIIALGIVLAMAGPIFISVCETAKRRMLLRLHYPDPPTIPGVYQVDTKPNKSIGGTILFTPPMPVQFDTASSTGSMGSLSIEARDWFEGTSRIEPVNEVALTILGPPKTWLVHRGHVLILNSDGRTFRTVASIEQYNGDGWGLEKHDRLDFDIPTEFFVHMVTAARLTGELDGKSFIVSAAEQTAFRDFAAYLRPGVVVKPPK